MCSYYRMSYIGFPDVICDSDSVISPLDTDELRGLLIDQLMENFGRDTGYEYRFADMDFRTVYYPRLTDVYEIEQDTNFLLLEYWICRRPAVGLARMPPVDEFSIYAGYMPHSEELHLLSDGFGAPLEERFNKILEENDGTPKLSNVCKSVLLVRLKYALGAVAVINDWCDFGVWIRAQSLFPPFDLSHEWRGRNSLFSFFPSEDQEFLTALQLGSETACDGKLLDYFDRKTVSEAMDSIEIVPLSVSQAVDTTFVRLTTHQFGGSAGEIATWEVALSGSGLVLSIRRTDSYRYGPGRL